MKKFLKELGILLLILLIGIVYWGGCVLIYALLWGGGK
jgi:hypothetical protein